MKNHGRKTNDYSPTVSGSPHRYHAINARREMLNLLDGVKEEPIPKYTRWEERMAKRAKGFELRH